MRNRHSASEGGLLMRKEISSIHNGGPPRPCAEKEQRVVKRRKVDAFCSDIDTQILC